MGAVHFGRLPSNDSDYGFKFSYNTSALTTGAVVGGNNHRLASIPMPKSTIPMPQSFGSQSLATPLNIGSSVVGGSTGWASPVRLMYNPRSNSICGGQIEYNSERLSKVSEESQHVDVNSIICVAESPKVEAQRDVIAAELPEKGIAALPTSQSDGSIMEKIKKCQRKEKVSSSQSHFSLNRVIQKKRMDQDSQCCPGFVSSSSNHKHKFNAQSCSIT